jgi:hypothetical protein
MKLINISRVQSKKLAFAAYSENQMKPVNILCGHVAQVVDVISGGTYRKQWVLQS